MSDQRQPISQRSEGPTPDALGLKVSGDTSLYQDLRRTQEVEIVVRGTVTSHIFEDKRDAHGNVSVTTKYAKVKVDELVEVTVLSTPRHMPGQTVMDVDADEFEASFEQRDAVVDAEVVGELEAGDPPPGVDKTTGEVTEEEDLDDFDRDPLIPEDAWGRLDRAEKAEVGETVDRIRRLGDALAQTQNPTDKKVAEEKIKQLAKSLGEDFGITLLDPAEIDDDDLPADKPPPPPVLGNTGPVSVAKLRERRAFLKAQKSLPREAKQARDEELAEIDRRLKAQEEIAS